MFLFVQKSLQEKLQADSRYRSESFGSQARITSSQNTSNIHVGTPDRAKSPHRVPSPTATVQKRSKDIVARPINLSSSSRIGFLPVRVGSRLRCGSPNQWSGRRRGSESPIQPGSSLRIIRPRLAHSGDPKGGVARKSFDVYSNGVYYTSKNSCEIQTDQVEIPNNLDLCMSSDLHSEYRAASKKGSDCWATCDHDEVEYIYDDGSNAKKSVSTSVGGQNISEVIIIGKHKPNNLIF